MEETTTLELSTRHQLVDLNKKLVNFKLDFNVVSLDDKEFEAVVMNQTDINKYDNLDTIEMKTAPKKISGNIIADNNVYENYFLILRSLESQKVEIKTTIEEIQPKIEENLELEKEVETEQKTITVPFYKTRGCWALIAIALILLGFYLKDHLFNKGQKKGIVETIKQDIVEPLNENVVSPFVQKINDTMSNVEEMVINE
jgi:hypothetical protein